MELIFGDFSLLCDPWIEGPAFLGAWRHYPQPCIKAQDLKPKALWISHEHSDHCHPQTLLCLDKDIPIYIPAFPNGRLEEKLAGLGFCNVISLPFGQRCQISEDFFLTLYEPASLWNDAQALFEIGGFRILNINDAGINHRIHKELGRVDCLCASFSTGASGYPATYTHLSSQQKIDIYQRSKEAMLDMLAEACELYQARYFLPFASHFILNHPKHLPYMQLLRKNTLEDVLHRFKEERARVIPLLAGDTWDVGEDKLLQRRRDKTLYEAQSLYTYIQEGFDEKEFLASYPSPELYRFDRAVVLEYFLNLNKIPEMVFCEDLSVSVYPDSREDLGFSFTIGQGRLQIEERLIQNPCLKMEIPSEVLMYICKNNESWDEATIGYWCRFSRNPDVYHLEFWRILQAPYYLKKPAYSLQKATSRVHAQSNVAELLEDLGEMGAKILARYGLYCLSCDRAPMESIAQACSMHGIDAARMQRMIQELNMHCGA